MLLIHASLLLLASIHASTVIITLPVDEDNTCQASPAGWFDLDNGTYNEGAPPPSPYYSFSLRPDFLTCNEVEQLHRHCIERLNGYRSGELTFTGGIIDSSLPKDLPPLQHATSNAQCNSQILLGDFTARTPNCAGFSHANAFACQAMQGGQFRSICCPQNVAKTYASVLAQMDAVLQQKWDEGLFNPQGASLWSGLKSKDYKYASCAFAFGKTADSTGRDVFLMSQHFSTKFAGQIGTFAPTKQPTSPPPTARPTFGPTVEPQCGNGIVEFGEQCDCGDNCEADKCCNAHTCQYASKAVCSAQDACCNLDTCSVHAAGTVCRAAQGECDAPDTCNGVSSQCPEDFKKTPGEKCGAGGEGMCGPCGVCVEKSMHKQCAAYDIRFSGACSWRSEDTMCGSLYCDVVDVPGSCGWAKAAQFGTQCAQGKYCSGNLCLAPEDIVCPTMAPTFPPTNYPTASPSKSPTPQPTKRPSRLPTVKPTKRPSAAPTVKPTKAPTHVVTKKPTNLPTFKPTKRPTSKKPSKSPTHGPTRRPSKLPTVKPSKAPSMARTKKPTKTPTIKPTKRQSN